MITREISHVWDRPMSAPWRARASLAALVVVLALAAASLHLAFGWPLADAWPSWPQVVATLTSSELSPAVARPLLGAVAWAMWGWLALTLAAQLLVAALEAVTRGARWAHGARRL